MSETLAPPTAVDLDACAAEPIRIPGGIQPHGALLVIDPKRLGRLQASANLAAFTGIAVEPGQTVEKGTLLLTLE